MKEFAFQFVYNLVFLATLTSCAQPKPKPESNAQESTLLQDKNEFCSGINLTLYNCPSNTKANDDLCSAICFLAKKLGKPPTLTTTTDNFSCPHSFGTMSLSPEVEPKIKNIQSLLSGKENCESACSNTNTIKCKTVVQLLTQIPAQPAEVINKPTSSLEKGVKNIDDAAKQLPVSDPKQDQTTNVNPPKNPDIPLHAKENGAKASSEASNVAVKEDISPVNVSPKDPEKSDGLSGDVPTVRENEEIESAPVSVAGKVSPPAINAGIKDPLPGESKEPQKPDDFANPNEEEDEDIVETDDTMELPGVNNPDDIGQFNVNPVRMGPPGTVSRQVNTSPFVEAEGSNFFIYFVTLICLTVIGYIAFHNKNKILALALEGRQGYRSHRRRPNSASYRKLDTSLEETLMSHPSNTPTPHVIY